MAQTYLVLTADILKEIARQLPHYEHILRAVCKNWNTVFKCSKNGSIMWHVMNNIPLSQNAADYADLYEFYYKLIKLGAIPFNKKWKLYLSGHALEYGHLNMIKYAYENGCNWAPYICEMATRRGRLDIVMYAHKNGCDLGYNIYNFAAERGYLDPINFINL